MRKNANLSTKGFDGTFNYDIFMIEVELWPKSPIVTNKHTAFYDEMRLQFSYAITVNNNLLI